MYSYVDVAETFKVFERIKAFEVKKKVFKGIMLPPLTNIKLEIYDNSCRLIRIILPIARL